MCLICFFLKLENFLHTLSHDDLPHYSDIYRPYLNKIVTPYSLRKHPFPLPIIDHTFTESSLALQLVKMKNNISVNDTLILKKIEERSNSHSGFSTYVKIPCYQDIIMNALYSHVAHANTNGIINLVCFYNSFKVNTYSLINCSSSLNHFLLIIVYTFVF